MLPSDDLSAYIPFYLACVLGAFGAALAGGWLGRGRLERPADPRVLKRTFLLLWLAAAGLYAAMAVRSLSTFRKFFDTAVEVQTIRNIAFGQGPVSSINAEGMGDPDLNASYLPYHACLAYYPAAALYRLLPHPATVVALGTICVALGAVPVWRISLAILGPVWGALVPPVAYLLYPTVQYASLWEFHALSLAAPLLGLAALAAFRGRPRGLWLWGGAALLVREDVALMGVLLGLYAAARPDTRRHGIAFSAAALAYFLVVTQILMPALSSRDEWWQMRLFSHLGDSFPDVAAGLFTRPDVVWRMATDPSRWGNAVLFFFPLAFLPLAAGRWALLYLPYFGLLFIGRDYAFYSIFLYYTVPLLPALAGGAALAAGQSGAARGAWLGAVLGGSIAASVLFGAAPWSVQFWSRDWKLAPFREPYFHASSYTCGAHEAAARRILDRIAAGEHVVAAHYFLPHLADRERAWLLHSPDRVPADARTAVFDTTRENAYMGLSYEDLEKGLLSLGFSVEAREDGIVLMRR